MTMENSGPEETSPLADTKQPATHAQVPNPSRRRFNRAGAGASAVILTLASGSVLAQGVCKSPSGFESGNVSGGGSRQPRCAGFTPQVWLERGISQDLPALRVTFASVFSPVSNSASVGKPIAGASGSTATNQGNVKLDVATLFQVLGGDAAAPVLKSLVAAYLNFSQQLNDFPTDIEIRQIYQEWTAKGTYTPMAGVTWGPSKIVDYLTATQTYTA
jgi:hypothetical protein